MMKTEIDLPMDRDEETSIGVLRLTATGYKIRLETFSWDSSVQSTVRNPNMTGMLDEPTARMLHSFLTLFLEDRANARKTHEKATENAKESW